MSETDIIVDYPTLTLEGIRAAAAHGAELARDETPLLRRREDQTRREPPAARC